MSSSVQDTQWRSFRSMNRNRPLKQARILATLLLFSSIYIYFLFASPQQSQQYVLELNTKESMRYYQQLHEHSLLLQERRHELAVKQHEARVRRNQARNATLLQKRVIIIVLDTLYQRRRIATTCRPSHIGNAPCSVCLRLHVRQCAISASSLQWWYYYYSQQQHHEHRHVDKNVKIDFANGHDN